MSKSKTSTPTVRQLVAQCARLAADVIEADVSTEDLLRALASALVAVKRDHVPGRSQPRFRDVSDPPGTAIAQDTSQVRQDRAALLKTVFGADVMSDIDFPTPESLRDFARRQGVQVSDRDSKTTIRQKLLSQAELRNMDDLIRRPEGR